MDKKYLYLFNKLTEAIELLMAAQQTTEEMYLNEQEVNWKCSDITGSAWPADAGNFDQKPYHGE